MTNEIIQPMSLTSTYLSSPGVHYKAWMLSYCRGQVIPPGLSCRVDASQTRKKMPGTEGTLGT